jgi:hypothetical protein
MIALDKHGAINYYKYMEHTNTFDPTDIYGHQITWSAARNITQDIPETDDRTDECIARAIERAGLKEDADLATDSDELRDAVWEGMDAWFETHPARLIAAIKQTGDEELMDFVHDGVDELDMMYQASRSLRNGQDVAVIAVDLCRQALADEKAAR